MTTTVDDRLGCRTDFSQSNVVTVPLHDDEPTIQIDKWKLQELWLNGIISDLTYVAFALQLHDKPTLDLQQFSRDWSVPEVSDSQKDEGLKPKTLKVRSILNAICVLDTKGMADCDFSAQVNQLSLFD